MRKKEIKTPDYTRRAVDNYREKFDFLTDKFPKGTKERLEAVGMTPADRVKAILDEIERREQQQNNKRG